MTCLRLTVELVPGGREAHKRVLATMTLANVTDTLTSWLDDYAIHAAEDVNPVAQRERWESRGLDRRARQESDGLGA